MLVTGQSGSGKRFLVKTYAAMFPATDDRTGRCVPVLYAEAPPHLRSRPWWQSLFQALAGPAARGGSTE